MKATIVIYIIKSLLSVLTPELLRDIVSKITSFFREKVLGSKSKVDDLIVLPLLDLLDEVMGVPDE